jgi:hypothetical protein
LTDRAEGLRNGPEEGPDSDDSDNRADLGTDEESLKDRAVQKSLVGRGG